MALGLYLNQFEPCEHSGTLQFRLSTCNYHKDTLRGSTDLPELLNRMVPSWRTGGHVVGRQKNLVTSKQCCRDRPNKLGKIVILVVYTCTRSEGAPVRSLSLIKRTGNWLSSHSLTGSQSDRTLFVQVGKVSSLLIRTVSQAERATGVSIRTVFVDLV